MINKNINNSIIDDIFGGELTSNQKAWKIINQFYHLILTKMEQDNITKVDLAKRLNKPKAFILEMFNKTPEISIKEMIEIADIVELDINLSINKLSVKD